MLAWQNGGVSLGKGWEAAETRVKIPAGPHVDIVDGPRETGKNGVRRKPPEQPVMEHKQRVPGWRVLLAATLLLAGWPQRAQAYITNPVQTLGQLCGSTYITVVRVEKVSKEKG